MISTQADIVICGAGIAGITAAYFLAVEQGITNVVLVDERPPLTLTSDKSTEAYRNWWPGPDGAMVALMNRSIDLLERLADASDNRFLLNRRGYVYATANPTQIDIMKQQGETAVSQGAGPLRIHTGQPTDPPYQPLAAAGYSGQPDGADLLLDPALIRRHFPYLSAQTTAVLHARRCGWFSGQQLGSYMLEEARAAGIRFVEARVMGVGVKNGRIHHVQLNQGQTIDCPIFVNAAGPLVNEVAALLGLDLPIFSELHLKLSFKDHLGVLPHTAPLLIWEDDQKLPWSDEERAFLAEDPETSWLLDRLPASVHCRPEGSDQILILWPYHTRPLTPVFPLPDDPFFPEVALRGMATMIPALAAYFERLPPVYVDGGYYTKTAENRPLIAPLPIAGAYIIGALSGFGLMAACAAGELLAAHIAGGSLPPYAPAFVLNRYDDPTYQQMLAAWGGTGQL
ncbi:MAG: FAD-binding oxidoreductase [Chloroflexota bacterium]